MPGPAPTPTAVKVLLGNPGQRPIGNDPQPEAGAPKMPLDLSHEAKAEWKRIVPRLDKIGMLSRVDHTALVVYCEAVATFKAATKDIQERGILVESKSNGEIKNPSISIAKDAAALIKQFGAEFGLTPASRSRLSLPESPTKELEDLLG